MGAGVVADLVVGTVVVAVASIVHAPGPAVHTARSGVVDGRRRCRRRRGLVVVVVVDRARCGLTHPHPHCAVLELGLEVDARRAVAEHHLDLGSRLLLDLRDPTGVGPHRHDGERRPVARDRRVPAAPATKVWVVPSGRVANSNASVRGRSPAWRRSTEARCRRWAGSRRRARARRGRAACRGRSRSRPRRSRRRPGRGRPRPRAPARGRCAGRAFDSAAGGGWARTWVDLSLGVLRTRREPASGLVSPCPRSRSPRNPSPRTPSRGPSRRAGAAVGAVVVDGGRR